MVKDFLADIESAYGSLENPDWSFVLKRLKQGMHDGLVKQLLDIASVEETTDPNDDCSRCLFLSSDTQALTLRLSLVGMFSCVHDVDRRFLSDRDLLRTELGRALSRLLEACAVVVVDDVALRSEVELRRESLTLYEVLFSSDGLM